LLFILVKNEKFKYIIYIITNKVKTIGSIFSIFPRKLSSSFIICEEIYIPINAIILKAIAVKPKPHIVDDAGPIFPSGEELSEKHNLIIIPAQAKNTIVSNSK
jgi:hypothetical protein